MKTRNLIKITALAVLALAVTSLSSCLKDPRFVNYAGSTPTVELPLAASTGEFQAEAYPIQTAPITLPVVVNLASPSTRSTATTVTLIVDQAAFTAYNAANGGGYTLLPAADYSISSLTVTIPAGQRTATMNISINSSLIDLSKAFLLPISISNGGGVNISTYSTIMYNVQAKNQYDGIWTCTGTMNDTGVPTNLGKYPVDYYLETQSATSVAMYDVAFYGGFAHEINAGGTNVYGSFAPVFTFNAANAVTTVVNYYGQPAGNGRSAAIDPTGQNKFTGGTTPGNVGATFQVNYFMYQPSVVPVGPRVFFSETFTYKGPRP